MQAINKNLLRLQERLPLRDPQALHKGSIQNPRIGLPENDLNLLKIL